MGNHKLQPQSGIKEGSSISRMRYNQVVKAIIPFAQINLCRLCLKDYMPSFVALAKNLKGYN